MMCHFSDIRCKEVISIKSGCRIGFVDDVEIDSCSAKICRIIVYGKSRCFGLFGREDDYILPWKCIVRIGGDIILVETEAEQPRRRRKKEKIFDKMAKNY